MSYNKNIIEKYGMGTLDAAYNNDQFGYVGPRTQFDLNMQKKWCSTCGGASCCVGGCSQTVENVSNSTPYAYPMLRTNFDMNMRKSFAPGMDVCMATYPSQVANVSNSTSYAYPMLRTNFDMNMRKSFAQGMGSCTYESPTKENFSYGLSMNDPNNIWSYTGNINCDATCEGKCNPYPLPVTNCGGSFEIVKGLGCSDGCTKPANTCSNYITNPYQN